MERTIWIMRIFDHSMLSPLSHAPVSSKLSVIVILYTLGWGKGVLITCLLMLVPPSGEG